MAAMGQHLTRAFLVLVVVVGCSDQRGEARTEAAERNATELYGTMSPNMESQVEGGVTRAEYDDATAAFAACLATAGHDIGPIVQDPLYPMLNNGSIPTAAFDDGTYDRCYGQEFAAIDMQWQAQMWDYYDAHPTEDPTYSRNLACARANGVSVPDGATSDDILKKLIDLGVQDTCGYVPSEP